MTHMATTVTQRDCLCVKCDRIVQRQSSPHVTRLNLTPPQVDLHPPPAQRSGSEELGGGTYTPPQLRARQFLEI